MCTLYANQKAREAIRALFRVSDNRAAAWTPRDAILPSETAPVVRLADDGERELVNLSWGFVRVEPGRAPRRVVNTRDDQVRGNPFWRDSFKARRCLVPATSYSEPQGVKPATWHWFSLSQDRPDRSSVDQRDRDSAAENNEGSPVGTEQPKRDNSEVGSEQLKRVHSAVGTGQLKRDQKERPLFAFPGLWRTYKGPLKKDGPAVELDVYTIMTTEPNALTAEINHERMPVLLTRDADFETWLHGTIEDAFALLRPYPADAMAHVGAGLERRDGADAQAGPAQSTLGL